MAGSVQTHESQVAGALDGADLAAVSEELEVVKRCFLVVLVAGPLELVGPGEVAKPVADEVGVTGVDQDGDLLKDAGNETVEGLHPVTLEEEVAVDVHVAGGVGADLGAEGLHNVVAVEVLLDPLELIVAEVAAGALGADVVGVLAGALVGTDHGVVTVDASGHARPDALAVVARLNELLAAGKGVVHSLALLLVKNSGPAAITASHGAVVLVLSKTVGEPVANKDRLQVDVALLVRQNLRGEDGDVVTSVALARDVEVLLGVLRELLEEEGEESVDVLASRDGVADSVAGVRVADVHGLVEEDDAGIRVPRAGVEFDLSLLVDGGRAELHEETGEGRAARATVEPQDHRVVLRVVAGLEEPVEEMLVILLVVEVATVLLHLVDAQDGRVNLLGAKVERLEVAIDLALFLALAVGDPDVLNRLAGCPEVPLVVGLPHVRLGQAEVGGLAHLLGEHHGNLVPDGASVVGEVIEVMFKVFERLGPEALVGGRLDSLLDGFGSLERLLLRRDGGGGCSNEER